MAQGPQGAFFYVRTIERNAGSRFRGDHSSVVNYSPVPTFLFSDVSFMPESSAIVSAMRAKSWRGFPCVGLRQQPWPICICTISRVAAVTASAHPARGRFEAEIEILAQQLGVKVAVQSRN